MPSDRATDIPNDPRDAALMRRVEGDQAAGPSFDDRAMDYLNKMNERDDALAAAREKEIAPLRQSALQASQDISRTSAEATQKLRANTKNIGEFQQPDLKQSAWQWMTIAASFGALAGNFSRYHTTAALNAFSGAMNGWAQGNMIKFNQNYQTWKANADAAQRNNAKALEEYEATMNNARLNLDQKMQQMQLVASKYQDQMVANAARDKNFTMVAQIMQKRDELSQRMAKDEQTMQYQHDKLMIEVAKLGKGSGGLNTVDGLLSFADRLSKLPPRQRNQAISLYQLAHPGGSPVTGDIFEKFQDAQEQAQGDPGVMGALRQMFATWGTGGKSSTGGETASTPPAGGSATAQPAAAAPQMSPETNIGPEANERVPFGNTPARAGAGAIPGVNTNTPVAAGPRGGAAVRRDGSSPQQAIRLTPGYARQQAARLPNGTWVIDPQTQRPVQILHKGTQPQQPPPNVNATQL
jgi:hypothetical protein